MAKRSMLSAAREAVGVSREEMAVRLGVSFATVVNWERNPEKLTIAKVKAYYDALPESKDEARTLFLASTSR